MRSPAVRTAVATVAFAGVHSLLASRGAKDFAERVVGTRVRNAVYRPAYNVVAVATTAALVGYVARQEARTIYHVRGPAAVAMRIGQVAAAVAFAAAAVQVGLGNLSGLSSVVPWLRGDARVPREAEAQSLPPDGDGVIRPAGVTRVSRHPLNLFPIPLLWLNPRMTTKLAAFNMVATVYFYLGSVHSDGRLGARYGGIFGDVCERVPLFAPGIAVFSGKNRVGYLFRAVKLLENKGKDR